MKRALLLTGLLWLLTAGAYAQDHVWEQAFAALTTVEDGEADRWQDAYEALCELEDQPIDLNTATREDLERIPFLTDQQIEDLCAYLYQYGGMKSLGELAMIPSLDFARRRLLTYFVCLSEQKNEQFPHLSEIARRGKHELSLTAKVPFYRRHGDDDGYLGYPYRHTLRYTFHYSEFVKAGIVGAQDAGEPFLAGKNPTGYDFYSFYLVVRKLGRLKALAVGRYKLRLGMGLVMNTDIGLGKMVTLSTLGRSTNTLRGYSSRTEANYLQGAAATVELAKGLDLTAFLSYRQIDATLNKGDSTIATILKTGYHRTKSEMQRRRNATQTTGGGNFRYFTKGFHIGATALYTCFDKPLQPKTTQLYRRHYPAGDRFWNISTDYGYTGHRVSLNGETATGDGHAMATLNSLSWQATESLQLMALQRFYSYRYHALLAESFNEGGAVQNESGLYLGMSWRPSRYLSLTAYSDYAYFAWPKYQAAQSSHAWDNLVQAVYNRNGWTLAARYRVKIREKDNDDKTALINQTTHRARLSAGYHDEQETANGFGKQETWSCRLQADVAISDYKRHSRGWMLTATAACRPLPWLKAEGSAAWFQTDDYDSRVYTYETGPLYSFTFPSFYGKGLHYTLFARADISSRWLVIAKLSVTDYLDRNHISSGLQQIDRSSMADVEVQAKWKF